MSWNKYSELVENVNRQLFGEVLLSCGPVTPPWSDLLGLNVNETNEKTQYLIYSKEK